VSSVGKTLVNPEVRKQNNIHICRRGVGKHFIRQLIPFVKKTIGNQGKVYGT
jgi:hypothetical protein